MAGQGRGWRHKSSNRLTLDNGIGLAALRMVNKPNGKPWSDLCPYSTQELTKKFLLVCVNILLEDDDY